jgi:hypothetical protein
LDHSWIIEQILSDRYIAAQIEHNSGPERGLVSCDPRTELTATQELPAIRDREEP